MHGSAGEPLVVRIFRIAEFLHKSMCNGFRLLLPFYIVTSHVTSISDKFNRNRFQSRSGFKYKVQMLLASIQCNFNAIILDADQPAFKSIKWPADGMSDGSLDVIDVTVPFHREKCEKLLHFKLLGCSVSKLKLLVMPIARLPCL